MQNERGQRLLSVRIVTVEAKFFYVLGFVLLGVLLARFVPLVGSVLADIIQLGAIWYGSRVFRSFGELVEAPRAGWRMTWRNLRRLNIRKPPPLPPVGKNVVITPPRLP